MEGRIVNLTRRQFGILGAAIALEWTAGCAAAGGSATPTSGTPATGTALPAGVAQPLRSPVARGVSSPPTAAGAALNQLGASLLQRMPAQGNAVLSPYSIYAVLAMARSGAKGGTATQLDAVLGAAKAQGGNVTAVDRAVAAALTAGKPPSDGDPSAIDMRPLAVEVANSLWTVPGLGVKQNYLDELAAGFGVGIFEIDFAADPEAARTAINKWVADHTATLIPELIPKDVIDVDTVLALVNAMHLSAPWQDPFTLVGAPAPFTTGAGRASPVKMMTNTGILTTGAGKGWTSVTIPYRGNGLAMTVVLPAVGAFTTVRADLAAAVSAAATSQQSGPVRLTMPTFASDSHLSLKPAMKLLGVVDLFGSGADLSGIAGRPGYLTAGELVHQSVISVDEKGTEAAAATALLVTATGGIGGEILELTVDRPFFYAVHDTVTGAALFLGQVTDPQS